MRWSGSVKPHDKVFVGALVRLTCGKSRIWETCTSGSVRGVESDLHPYRDKCCEATFARSASAIARSLK